VEPVVERKQPGTVESVNMKKFIERIQERTGIYSLGFDVASMAGIALPVGFVVVVGGILAFLVLR